MPPTLAAGSTSCHIGTSWHVHLSCALSAYHGPYQKMRALAEARKGSHHGKEPDETTEPKNNYNKWNNRAWDAFEYRADVRTLSQHDDRGKSSRASLDTSIHKPTSSLWGPNLREEEEASADILKSTRGDLGSAMGAMMAAASPRR